jgi:predicted DNA-binding transcriptional regulator AlpA
MTKSDFDTLLTVSGAAEFLQLSESWLNKARISGDGPRFIKMGRSVRYSLQALEELSGRTQGAPRPSTSVVRVPAVLQRKSRARRFRPRSCSFSCTKTSRSRSRGLFWGVCARRGSAVGSTETTGILGNVDESIYVEILLMKLSLGMNTSVRKSCICLT